MNIVNKLFDQLLALCALASGLVLAGIAVAISLNVILRNLFAAPIYGLLDAVEYGLLLVTFVGAPWVLSKNAHVVVDLVTSVLPVPMRRQVARLVALLGATTSGGLCYFGMVAAQQSYNKGSIIRTAFEISEWWTLSVMPFALLLTTLEFLRQAMRPPSDVIAKTGL